MTPNPTGAPLRPVGGLLGPVVPCGYPMGL